MGTCTGCSFWVRCVKNGGRPPRCIAPRSGRPLPRGSSRRRRSLGSPSPHQVTEEMPSSSTPGNPRYSDPQIGDISDTKFNYLTPPHPQPIEIHKKINCEITHNLARLDSQIIQSRHCQIHPCANLLFEPASYSSSFDRFDSQITLPWAPKVHFHRGPGLHGTNCQAAAFIAFSSFRSALNATFTPALCTRTVFLGLHRACSHYPDTAVEKTGAIEHLHE